MQSVFVLGAGLAGCEAAWQLAQRGVEVCLYEMKPSRRTPAHSYDGFAELVCSNSLKSADPGKAPGMLKQELRALGSLLIACADATAVPAGGALAVDRARFSDLVTAKIRAHPRIRVVEGEAAEIPSGVGVVATGPLTTDSLMAAITSAARTESRAAAPVAWFYDAAAPIVTAESVDMNVAFYGARYGKGEPDYLNCPMDKAQYEAFYSALITAQTAPLHEVDAKPKVYEGCMPIEVLAKRGQDSIRFGPLKPVGFAKQLTVRPYAVVQLRKENAEGRLYNLVGFQTNLKFGEQKRVFSMIPGLERAEFVRYGVMHRNTYIDSPRLLDVHLRLKSDPRLFFAGQLTGLEGYNAAIASGLYTGLNAANTVQGRPLQAFPLSTMLGALAAHVSDPTVTHFQPIGPNRGILRPDPPT